MTGRLKIDPDGRVSGPISISYNNPFPTVNGSEGSGAMMGVIMHTMVGNLPGTIEVFNDSAKQVSAYFGIAQDGSVHQFGPIGKGWVAWAEMNGNSAWYSIEHADNGNTHNPLTDAQLAASAQLVEVLSRFAGFPLQVTDSVSEKGYGTHEMGGGAWGGHTCPNPGPRAAQRYDIIKLAKAIRADGGGGDGGRAQVTWTSDGSLSLLQLAAQHKTAPSAILRMTAIHDGLFPGDVAAFINGVFGGTISPQSALPKGIVLQVPGN